jgi:threonine dehydrogenase-like Zn-dependent dehydrogenase
MPRALVATAPRTPAIHEYTDTALQPNQIRVNTRFGAPKHGTELHMYRGDSPIADSHWDPELLAFVQGGAPSGGFPRPLGNMAVGDVIEVGSRVAGVSVGDLVAGYGPLRETETWVWGDGKVYPGVRLMTAGMSWQSAVCLDPATVALGGVRDGGVRVGDRVAVFGLGAIGLMAVQVARVAGASFVAAVDPISARRDVALATGADVALDPTACDVGLEIKLATGKAGVDVSIETSGNGRALHHAIRALQFRGTVAVVGWYNEIRGGLDLGREAHLNRPTLVFPRAESEPHYDHPRWNNKRLSDAAWNLLARGLVRGEPVVQPVVRFEDAASAYRDIDEHPERSVKLGVTFA